MTTIIESIRGEYLRYKALAEAAMSQLTEAELSAEGPNGSNSIAVICWHVSGNLRSRFTDFLTGDGEKPWRRREEEFQARSVSRDELISKWEQGWEVLLQTLGALRDDQLGETVTIRGQPLTVHEALQRSLAHASYHAGQIVYLAKSIRGEAWKFLSIPPGGSTAYNQDATKDRPASHAAALSKAPARPSEGGSS
ncbi:MAG: DUF1572 domain-containing protein [Luteitalea sp.]|nr:DUF1572 domain-containing protein [Luteitalea sp.]